MRNLMSEYARDILHTEFSTTLPSLPPNIFSLVTYLKGKPLEEQKRILIKTRERIIPLLKRIDERLQKIEKEQQ